MAFIDIVHKISLNLLHNSHLCGMVLDGKKYPGKSSLNFESRTLYLPKNIAKEI